MTSSEADSPLLLFSVIIPTRHRNDLLGLCLDRLAPGAQTLDPSRYEVIVTDDGSQSTAEQMIAREYPWARWVPGPRKGPAANRNSGAAHARGDWLVFTDDDCVPEHDWLSAYAAAIRPDVKVLEGRTTCRAGIPSPLYQSPINLTGGWLWSCNMAIRSITFRDLGGFDEDYPLAHMEDTDFRERLKAAGIAFEFTAGAVVDHPPRKLPPGRKRALSQECYVIYCNKHGIPVQPFSVLRLVTLGRLRTLIRDHRGRDAFTALWSLGEELVVLAANLPRWKRRHAPTRRRSVGTRG